jgi:HK97 family phage major capsid protein
MSKFYKALLQKQADLISEQKSIVTAVEAREPMQYTDAERQRDDAIVAELGTVRADLAREEARRQFERAAPASEIVGGHNRIEDDPKRGFAHLGEFALAVKNAYSPGGVPDDRLRFGAAPTNYHKETGSDEGRMVPPAFKAEIFEAVTSGVDSLLAAVDTEPTSSNAVEILADESTPWGATGVQAYWRSEGQQMNASKLATAGQQVRLHELYAFVLATGEILQDAARLGDRLARKSALAIQYKANEAIVNGTGAGQPLGWFTSAAKVSVAKESGQAADTVVAANVAKMYARVISPGKAIWYINQDTLPQLLTMTLGNNSVYVPPASGFQNAPGGFLFGRPVQFLENCPTVGDQGDIQLVNPKGYYATVKGSAPEFAESMHLFFDYNVSAFRWIFRLGGQPYLSAAISPAKGSVTRSHVVVLDARA